MQQTSNQEARGAQSATGYAMQQRMDEARRREQADLAERDAMQPVIDSLHANWLSMLDAPFLAPSEFLYCKKVEFGFSYGLFSSLRKPEEVERLLSLPTDELIQRVHRQSDDALELIEQMRKAERIVWAREGKQVEPPPPELFASQDMEPEPVFITRIEALPERPPIPEEALGDVDDYMHALSRMPWRTVEEQRAFEQISLAYGEEHLSEATTQARSEQALFGDAGPGQWLHVSNVSKILAEEREHIETLGRISAALREAEPADVPLAEVPEQFPPEDDMLDMAPGM